MNGGSFILRFDDIAPGMAWDKFLPVKERLVSLGIRAVLGVVPECRDPGLDVGPRRGDFFELVRQWAAGGDAIAQHGTHHVYDSGDAGVLRVQSRSEFAGHSFPLQLDRLAHGKAVLQREGVWQPYFMAPSHSFDRCTLKALAELDFLALTDGYGFHPYEMEGMLLVPQLTERPLKVPLGVQTLCVHVNSMDQGGLTRLLGFVAANASRFVDFKDVVRHGPARSPAAPLLRYASSIGLRRVRQLRAVLR